MVEAALALRQVRQQAGAEAGHVVGLHILEVFLIVEPDAVKLDSRIELLQQFLHLGLHVLLQGGAQVENEGVALVGDEVYYAFYFAVRLSSVGPALQLVLQSLVGVGNFLQAPAGLGKTLHFALFFAFDDFKHVRTGGLLEGQPAQFGIPRGHHLDDGTPQEERQLVLDICLYLLGDGLLEPVEAAVEGVELLVRGAQLGGGVHQLHLEGAVDDQVGDLLEVAALAGEAPIGVALLKPAQLAVHAVAPHAAVLKFGLVVGIAGLVFAQAHAYLLFIIWGWPIRGSRYSACIIERR